MTIVLNEQVWAKEMIEARSLGKRPYETLCRVAKYYLNQGYSKQKTRDLIETFVLQCDQTASLPKWAETIDYAVDRASKYSSIEIDRVSVSTKEIERINALPGRQLQRLAFTLLCLAKYWDLVNPNGDHWVNSKDSDIMRMANINTSIRRQSAMYHTLRELGLIQFSKKVDNTNVRVCFIEDGPEAVGVSDYRNLGYQYLMYRGEPYFTCESCGVTTKLNDPIKGRKKKYCKTCAQEIAMRQNINSVMRLRNQLAAAF